MEYGATVWDPYNSDKVVRVQRRAAKFVKSRYSRYSSVSDMLDVLDGHLFLKGDRRLDLLFFSKLLTVWHILFYKIINGLAHSFLQNY